MLYLLAGHRHQEMMAGSDNTDHEVDANVSDDDSIEIVLEVGSTEKKPMLKANERVTPSLLSLRRGPVQYVIRPCPFTFLKSTVTAVWRNRGKDQRSEIL